MYKQGDIVIIRFPFTDGSVFKKRPALVISNNKVNKTGDYLVVQITSKLIDDDLSMQIADKDCITPLPLQSTLRLHKIFTISQSLIISRLTAVKLNFLQKVCTKITALIIVPQ